MGTDYRVPGIDLSFMGIILILTTVGVYVSGIQRRECLVLCLTKDPDACIQNLFSSVM